MSPISVGLMSYPNEKQKAETHKIMAEFVRIGKYTFNLDSIAHIVSEDGGERYGTIHRIHFIGQEKPLELTGDTPEGKLFSDWFEHRTDWHDPSDNEITHFKLDQ